MKYRVKKIVNSKYVDDEHKKYVRELIRHEVGMKILLDILESDKLPAVIDFEEKVIPMYINNDEYAEEFTIEFSIEPVQWKHVSMISDNYQGFNYPKPFIFYKIKRWWRKNVVLNPLRKW